MLTSGIGEVMGSTIVVFNANGAGVVVVVVGGVACCGLLASMLYSMLTAMRMVQAARHTKQVR